jgi:multiple sugar transport system ATP-binding protein
MGQITLQRVRKSFGPVNIIKDANLDIEDGSFVVFVGPSGCGKTTLLRLIAGLEDVTGGQILIDGRNVVDVPPAKRGLSMVFQSYALYPHMSVRGNIAFGLKMAGLPRPEIDRKVEAAAATLNLTPYLDRKPRELSGGQRQRVAIGRAIVREPKAFLFDEPLSNLDAALRVQMRLEVTKLQKQLGTTAVYVTHDQVEAMTMADKIVVLNAGRIEQYGSPLELYERPANLFVAGFIGSPKMNFLDAKVAAVSPGGVTAELPGGAKLTVPVLPGRLKAGDAVKLGVRPEHLRPGDVGELEGEVMVVERLGGETFLYTHLANDVMLVVQADGEIPTRVHDRIKIKLNPITCHLFDQSGAAVQRAHRHPLADLGRLAERKAS